MSFTEDSSISDPLTVGLRVVHAKGPPPRIDTRSIQNCNVPISTSMPGGRGHESSRVD